MSDLGDGWDLREESAYGYEEQPTGADGRYIRDRLMPEFWGKFAIKAKDYNDSDGFEPHKVLGIAGQFAEVWRKVWKLKKGLWDRETLIHEQPREVLLDMIGHCFLAIAMIDQGKNGEHFPTQPAVKVNGEPWQGRTKPGAEPLPVETVTRPNGSLVRLLRDAGSQPWPMCGREKCVNCSKATLRTVLANTNAKIIKGPADEWDDQHPEPSHSVTAASQNACACSECVDGHA